MCRIRRNYCLLAALVASLLSPPVFALNLETGVGVGMEYTDNAAFTADNEEDDLIAVASVNARLDTGSGPTYLKADASFKKQSYTQDTFDNQQYSSLGATAGWETFKDRLDWTMQDYFTQRSVNSLDPTTPDNTQNTNVFTFGPNIYFPISSRQSATIRPVYRKFAYDVQSIDNQQNGLDANWGYRFFRTMSLGVRGSVNKVDYDEELIADITFKSAYLTISGTRPHSSYSMDLGSTSVSREGGDSTRGFTGNVRWLYNVTGYSNVSAFISSEITDSNNGLLNSSTNPDDGDFANEQISAGVYRNSIVRLSYSRDGAGLKTNIWTELREQDYEQLASALDREVQEVGIRFTYPVTATVSTGINTSFNRTELTDRDRIDDRYIISGNINYLISRRLSAVASLKFQERDSNIDTADYSEMSMFVGVVYGYGQFPRPTRSGGTI